MYLSELLAISAAACIALSGMLIGELTGRVPLLVLTRWQMIASFAMTGAASLATGGWRTIEPWQVGSLALSGLFGIIIASTTYFAAIYIAGARMTALLFSLSAPFAVLFGYLWLGETVSGQQGRRDSLGAGRRRARNRRSEAGQGAGHSDGSFGPRASRPARDRAGCGHGHRAGARQPRRPSGDGSGSRTLHCHGDPLGYCRRFFVALSALPIPGLTSATNFTMRTRLIAFGAAFFGIGLGMSLLMAALVNGNVGIVSTLSSLTPVLILPMVWVPSASAWGGAILAVVGTALISL